MQRDTPTPEPRFQGPLARSLAKDYGLHITADGRRLFEVKALVKKARTILNGMELDGLIETQDGDTYRITAKGKAQAALHREGRV